MDLGWFFMAFLMGYVDVFIKLLCYYEKEILMSKFNLKNRILFYIYKGG